MLYPPQKLELEESKQLQLKDHEEKVKNIEAELTQVKLENNVLLKEKSQLTENITTLVSAICYYRTEAISNLITNQ